MTPPANDDRARTGETREEYIARRKRDRHNTKDVMVVALRVPWEMHRDLTDAAYAQRRTATDCTREAIADWLKKVAS